MNYYQPKSNGNIHPTCNEVYSSLLMSSSNKSMIMSTKNIMMRTEEQKSTSIDDKNLSSSVLSEEKLIKCKKERYREHQRRKRASLQYRHAHAARERQRVAEFNKAFKKLHSLLPTNPTGRRLSKLQILKLCSSYISYLTWILKSDCCYFSYI
ncbi:unnamed protein product [Heterobilharzia americana]|nr:unnamed protein product [Heterobilharzia americana]CAH8434190.1 unnamed protein product [Heterobilharzia americana]